jgi:hypothetical protein
MDEDQTGDLEIIYSCVTGHLIPDAELDRLTEVVSLDAGAQVRICREHGAPISLTKGPAAGGKPAAE